MVPFHLPTAVLLTIVESALLSPQVYTSASLHMKYLPLCPVFHRFFQMYHHEKPPTVHPLSDEHPVLFHLRLRLPHEMPEMNFPESHASYHEVLYAPTLRQETDALFFCPTVLEPAKKLRKLVFLLQYITQLLKQSLYASCFITFLLFNDHIKFFFFQ